MATLESYPGLTAQFTAKYAATQIGTHINATQKEIGAKKKVCNPSC